MAPRAGIVGIATAVPPYCLDQGAVRELAASLYQHEGAFDRLCSVFVNCHIDRRYAAIPLDWYDEPRGWPERNSRTEARQAASYRASRTSGSGCE